MTQDLASGRRESGVGAASNGKGEDIPDVPPPPSPRKHQPPEPPAPPKAVPSAEAGDPAPGADGGQAECEAGDARDDGQPHAEPEPMELDGLDIIGEMRGMLDKLDSLRQHCEDAPEPEGPRGEEAPQPSGGAPETEAPAQGSPEARPQKPPSSPQAGPQKPPSSPEAGPQKPPSSPQAEPQKPPSSPEAGPQKPPSSPQAEPQKPPLSPETGPQKPPSSPEAGPQKPPLSPEAGPQKPPSSPEAGPQKPPSSPEAGPQKPPLSPEAGPQNPPSLPPPHDQAQAAAGASAAGLVIRYHILGFSNQALNSIYSISNIVVGGQQTYWSPGQDYFMYFQADIQKWQISPRAGPSERVGGPEVDLLEDALRGGQRGLAMQLEETAWREFVGGVWRLVDLQIGFDMGDGQFAYTSPGAGPSYEGNAAPGTPAPAWSTQGTTSRMPMTPQVNVQMNAPVNAPPRIPQTPREKLLQKAGLGPVAPSTPSAQRIPQTPVGGGMPGDAAGRGAPSSSSMTAKILSMPERFLPDHFKAAPPPKKRKVNEEPTLVNFGKATDRFPVWIGHFRESVTLGQILQFFSQCGPIVGKDKGKTQAVLHFESSEDRDAAVALDGARLAGEEVRVRAQEHFEPEPVPAETSWSGRWTGEAAAWEGQQGNSWNGRGDHGWGGGHQTGQEYETWGKSWSAQGEGAGKDWTDWRAPKAEAGAWMDQRVESHGSGSHGAGWGQKESKTMEIPSEMLGLIIGRGGERIKRLQEQSGAKMDLDKGDSSQPRTLTLSGYSSSVAEGVRMIQEILDRGPPKKASGKGWGAGGPDGAAESMEIPRDKAAMVIGKGGEVIKRLQAQSGATLKLEGNRPDAPGPCLVRMSGPPECVSRARSLVQELVGASGHWHGKGSGEAADAGSWGAAAGAKPWGSGEAADAGSWGGAAGAKWGSGEAADAGMWGSAAGAKPCKGKGKALPTDHITIPAEMASVVTGAGGEALKRLQRQTGARITLEDGAAIGGSSRVCRVCFSGSLENISRAKALVQTIVGAEEEEEEIGAPPSSWAGAQAGQAGAGAAFGPGQKLQSGTPHAADAALASSGDDDFERLCAQEANRDDDFDQLCAAFEAEASANPTEGEFDCLPAAMSEGTLEDASMQPAPGEDEFERLCAAAAAGGED